MQLLSQRSVSHICCLLTSKGIDFKIRTIEIGDKKIKLQIWFVILCQATSLANFLKHVRDCVGIQLAKNGFAQLPQRTTEAQWFLLPFPLFTIGNHSCL
jgi:hypothetical protein